MPHRVCLTYFPELIAWMAITDLVIAAACVAMATSLHVYARSSGVSVPAGYRHTLYGLEVFVLLCGATFALDMVTLWWPVYEAEAAVKGVCAAVSVAVAVALVRFAPDWALDNWRNAMRILRDAVDEGCR